VSRTNRLAIIVRLTAFTMSLSTLLKIAILIFYKDNIFIIANILVTLKVFIKLYNEF